MRLGRMGGVGSSRLCRIVYGALRGLRGERWERRLGALIAWVMMTWFGWREAELEPEGGIVPECFEFDKRHKKDEKAILTKEGAI